MQFLGKQVKTFQQGWKVIESSIQKIKASELKKVLNISVHQSDFDETQLYALIELSEGYVSFTLDAKCRKHLAPGDLIDPKTVIVFDLTNGEKTITRMFGKKLG